VICGIGLEEKTTSQMYPKGQPEPDATTAATTKLLAVGCSHQTSALARTHMNNFG